MPESGSERRIADRYAMRTPPLGRGGMGVVWRARDTVLGREVAIKEVQVPAALPDDERARIRGRVMREARVAARLNHAGAVTLHDIIDQDGHPFIVMELVEAPTLTDLVDERGPLPPAEVAAIGLALLDTLEAAHRVGIVHRDVKPGNVMVRPDGSTKLADFGIASVQGDPVLTASTGLLAGSPAYMAPEQAEAEFGPIGPATDLWALGATMYFAVEGEPPFDRGSPLATLAAVVYDEPRPATRAGALSPVLAGLLTKPPAARLTAPDLRRLLRKVAAGNGSEPGGRDGTEESAGAAPAASPTVPRLAAEPSATTATAQFEAVSDHLPAAEPVTGRPRRRRRRGLGALAVVVVLLAGGLGWSLLRGEWPEWPARTGTSSPSTAATPATVAWTAYHDPDGAFHLAHPPRWKPRKTRRPGQTEFRDPADPSRIVRVEISKDTRDPLDAWQEVERDFKANHPDDDYRRIALQRTLYQERWQAAAWEFTYVLNGHTTRVYDLAVTTTERRYAVQFQADAADWAGFQGVLNRFLAEFSVE
ncbi:MAG TPA: serine/threonine-protein kinase [Actinomycetota bacterium]|nr:serine/threonine-protein kinase [Actinomycetota bacterium]